MYLTELEKNAVDRFRISSETSGGYMPSDSPDGWLHFGILILLRVGRIIRENRLTSLSSQVSFKADGSPVSEADCTVEMFIQNELALFCKNASLIGEEGGGSIALQGYGLAVDPIDGTWSYLNRLETISTSILFTHDSVPFLGMIFNPVTGELGYGGQKFPPRILQLSMFGEGERGFDLPLERVTPESIVVNIHPQRHAAKVLTSFYTLWINSEINMVRSAGGSPSHALLDVAKGSSNYINLWSKKKAAPYDITAGISIVRSTGGEVVDINGSPVQWFDHSGPFIALSNPDAVDILLPKLRKIIGNST